MAAPLDPQFQPAVLFNGNYMAALPRSTHPGIGARVCGLVDKLKAGGPQKIAKRLEHA